MNKNLNKKNSLENLSINFDKITVLGTAKPKVRKGLIQTGGKDFICSICEIIDYLMIGNLQIDKSDQKKLEKYKYTLRKLLKSSTLKEKKNLLIQKGGFLQFLIPSVISGIASIVGSYIESKSHKDE